MPRKLLELQWKGNLPSLTKSGPCAGPCPTCLTPQDCAQAAFEVLHEILATCQTSVPLAAEGDAVVSVGIKQITQYEWHKIENIVKRRIKCLIPINCGKNIKSMGVGLMVVDCPDSRTSCCEKYLCLVQQLAVLNKFSEWNPESLAGAVSSLSGWISSGNKVIPYHNQ